MNPDNAPLVNKLTLLVLSLILVCLVLLVVRAYQKPTTTDEPPAVAEAEVVSDIVEETSPAAVPVQTRPPEPPRRAPNTNTARVALPGRTPLPAIGAATSAPSSTPAQLAETPTALVAVSESVQTGTPLVSGVSGNSGAGFSLVGWAILTGKPKPEVPIDLGPTCSSLRAGKVTTRHFVVSREGGLANVLVYVQNARHGTPLVEPPLLDQVGCMFEPYVLGVVTGQKFRIRNSDPTLHNVHATPKINREFNFGQPMNGQVNEVFFPKPELFIRLKCDVHPWMFSYVNVVDHPYFAITDTNGFFRLPAGLPAGDYTVSAVHLKAGELMQQISLSEGEQRTLQFQFSATPGAQPQGRVARSN
jgi:hypothetical protein